MSHNINRPHPQIPMHRDKILNPVADAILRVNAGRIGSGTVPTQIRGMNGRPSMQTIDQGTPDARIASIPVDENQFRNTRMA